MIFELFPFVQLRFLVSPPLPIIINCMKKIWLLIIILLPARQEEEVPVFSVLGEIQKKWGNCAQISLAFRGNSEKLG